MIKRILFFTMFIALSCKTTKLPPNKAVEKLGANPYFEIDGQSISKNELGNIEPTDIALLTTYYNKEAMNRFGEKAKDGAVIIETKEFATNKYESLFKIFSIDYKIMIKETDKRDIQYILNDRILTENFEGDLASLNDKLLKEIKIIDQKKLLDKYQIQDKKIGVVIRTKRPKYVYNSKKKF